MQSWFFFSSRRRHTRYWRDWSSDVCSSDLGPVSALCGRDRPIPFLRKAVEDPCPAGGMVGKPVEAHYERPAAGLKDRNLQSACLNRPMTDAVGRLGPPGRGVLAKARSLGHLCHEFNLQAAFAASRSGKPGPSSKYGCLKPRSVPVSGATRKCRASGRWRTRSGRARPPTPAVSIQAAACEERASLPRPPFPVPGVEDAVMRLNPASTNLVETRSEHNRS